MRGCVCVHKNWRVTDDRDSKSCRREKEREREIVLQQYFLHETMTLIHRSDLPKTEILLSVRNKYIETNTKSIWPLVWMNLQSKGMWRQFSFINAYIKSFGAHHHIRIDLLIKFLLSPLFKFLVSFHLSIYITECYTRPNSNKQLKKCFLRLSIIDLPAETDPWK